MKISAFINQTITFYNLFFHLQSAPCKTSKRRLLMVGWNSILVWWETTVFVIMLIQAKSRLLSRIPLPSQARGRLGRERSHTEIPPPWAVQLARNISYTAASQLRGRSVKWLQKLFCPLTAPPAVTAMQGPCPQTHWMFCSQEMQLFRTKVKPGIELRINLTFLVLVSPNCWQTRQCWGGNP